MRPPDIERAGPAHPDEAPPEEIISRRQATYSTRKGSAPRAQPIDGDDVRVSELADRIDLERFDPAVRAALRAPLPAPRAEGWRTVVAVARLRARRREVDAAVAALGDESVVVSS